MDLINYKRLTSVYASDLVGRGKLLYDARDASPETPSVLLPFVVGTHNLYTRQVPSALHVKRAGARKIPDRIARAIGLRVPSIIPETEDDDQTSSGEEEGVTLQPEEAPGCAYEDPFMVLAGYEFAGKFLEERPVINVWHGGCRRLTDRLPQRLFGSDRKNACSVLEVSTPAEVMYFLRNHTHWGNRVQMARLERKPGLEKQFAETFWKRISSFVRGRRDPIWTASEVTKYYGEDPVYRPTRQRVARLVEVLKTVDGLFLQRFLSLPEELWDWEKYDMFVIHNLSFLISDEFLDGVLTEPCLGGTFFEELKRARKTAKLALHTSSDRYLQKLKDSPRWVATSLETAWKAATRSSQTRRVFLNGMLSQTRAAGTPPAAVVLKSKRKFARTVQEDSPRLTPTQRLVMRKSMSALATKLPREAFTGLSTKARVTVTGSACAEATRREGGTYEALLQLVHSRDDMIPVRDFDTGKPVAYKKAREFESAGEALFHCCLDEVLRTQPEDLRRVTLATVKEPAKARTVTKGPAALKVVLDTVSKICAWPLKKVPSSKSGMGKSHHGWNLFTELFDEENYKTLFHPRTVEEDEYVDHIVRTYVWDDVYFSSTDYQEATDFINHEVAADVGEFWMRRCGIPPLLRGIVHAVCFRPRTVRFAASGPLAAEGIEVEPGFNEITLKRGVLMGDPLTKVILHLVNILAREIGNDLSSGKSFHGLNRGQETAHAFMRAMEE
nr:putative RNA-dependent RNA polymerase [Leptosphaeria biglobosa narnavirus 12]